MKGIHTMSLMFAHTEKFVRAGECESSRGGSDFSLHLAGAAVSEAATHFSRSFDCRGVAREHKLPVSRHRSYLAVIEHFFSL